MVSRDSPAISTNNIVSQSKTKNRKEVIHLRRPALS